MKPKLLVSACLLGTPCRYDGKSKKNEAVCALAERFEPVSYTHLTLPTKLEV